MPKLLQGAQALLARAVWRTAPSNHRGTASEDEEIALRDHELAATHSLLDAALNNMAHGLFMLDRDQRVVLCNRQMRLLFNLDPDIVRPGATIQQVMVHAFEMGNYPGQTFAQIEERFLQVMAARTRVSFHRTGRDGRMTAVNWVPMPDGGWVSTYEDVTARVAATARAMHLASHDVVTGLPNRAGLTQALLAARPPGGIERRTGAGFSLLCLEIGRFRAICDACGHSAGDRLLQLVAQRLRGCVRTGDMVAYLGGASFAILEVASGEAQVALRLAERALEAVQAPLTIDGRTIVVQASIGIATSGQAMPTDPKLADAEEMLRRTTLALHAAAARGGGCIELYAADMDRAARDSHTLEADLRAALGLRQFELHYQPLVSHEQGRVTGFEALLRWRHPERGLVPPASFIPLAEELGLIGAIGAWVLRTACTEAAGWPADVRVAVNLSPLQFGAGAGVPLPEIVAETLAHTGLPGHRLELEITEAVRLLENAGTLAMLHRLRDLGVRIALDDFGTGYSSLSYLRCFPFDKLKIDQSFVRGLPDPESAAIVRAVIALGCSLGMSIVAEGVETSLQQDALLTDCCDEMQGYLFSPPRPACEVAGLIAQAARICGVKLAQ